MKALVIHPNFKIYGGGEFLCLNVCSILQKRGFDITIASDSYKPEDIDIMYSVFWGNVMRRCTFRLIPEFGFQAFSKAIAVKRILYARSVRGMFRKEEWDVVFSTQSSVFNIHAPQYHFVYHLGDIFARPAYAKAPTGRGHRGAYGFILKKIGRAVIPADPDPDHIFGLSTELANGLKRLGYDSSFIFPPCDMPFRPQSKVKRVVQATRIAPEKRLEWFFEAAHRLPEYEFLLIGRDGPENQRLNPGYSAKLMKAKPQNLRYIESPVRRVASLLEESKVYLYTGEEPGIGITCMEAVGAGCIPVCPEKSGGADVVRFSSRGSTFNSIPEMIDGIERAMGSDEDPERIAEKAKIFSSDSFERAVTRRLKM